MPDPIDTLTGPRFVVTGRVVTMNDNHDVIANGRIYINDGTLMRRKTPATPDGFSAAPIVQTGGHDSLGLIELHNHLPYDVCRCGSCHGRSRTADSGSTCPTTPG